MGQVIPFPLPYRPHPVHQAHAAPVWAMPMLLTIAWVEFCAKLTLDALPHRDGTLAAPSPTPATPLPRLTPGRRS